MIIFPNKNDKSFFPKICPGCGQPLIIDLGDKSDTFKLACANKNCAGSLLKRLQKGIIALEIRGLGPATIENLMNAGISSALDLFNIEIFNEKNLISSGYFTSGRSLEKILDSVKNTKSIKINKFILSLQIDDVGKTVSEKMGQLLSGVNADFTGLPYSVRDNLDLLTLEINEKIKLVEDSGVEIERYTPPKKIVATKKVTKVVAIDENVDEIREIVQQLNWGIVSLDDPKCKMYIGDDSDGKVEALGIKVYSLKKVKLIFC